MRGSSGFSSALARRVELTGAAARSAVLAVPALVFSTMIWLGMVLALLGGIGFPLLAKEIPQLEQLCDRQRRIAGTFLGAPVRRVYADTSDLAVSRRVIQWAKDPARWKDFGWTYYTSTVGFTLSAASLALLLYPLWSITWFFLWLGLPDLFSAPMGFFHIHTTAQAVLYAVAGAVVAVALWALLVVPLEHLRLRWDARILGDSEEDRLRRRVAEVTTARDETVDASAAELRRVERDLHDGPQARLAALAMNLGLAEEMLDKDPETVRSMLAEARTNASGALGDLRSVVHGIHPPVLADRGLEEAIHALAVDLPTPIALHLTIAERLPAPVESALYFAVAECLANMSKHSGSDLAEVTTQRHGDVLYVEVADDGRGGAVATGSGLHGVARRLAALDGRMSVSSPQGGPTVITMEVPCASSSVRTTPFSGTV